MVAHRLCVQSRPRDAGGLRGPVEPAEHDRRHHLRPARRSRRHSHLMVGAQPLRLMNSSHMADPIPRRADATKATFSSDVFDDPNWIVERKLDGFRCLAFRDGGPVALESRNRLSLNQRYPEVAAALEDAPSKRFVVDGEVVGLSGGRSSFEALQRRGHDRGVTIAFYVFDVLWLDGVDLRARALRERKAALRSALSFGDGVVRWTPYRRAHEGERLLREACRSGWEGLIAKRADSPYAGKRTRDWLKWKCSAEQELVIGGYTAPPGAREDFGPLPAPLHRA